MVESGAGTRWSPLSGFDIRVLIEILWIPSPHVSSVIVTVQDSSENAENDKGTTTSHCLLNLTFE